MKNYILISLAFFAGISIMSYFGGISLKLSIIIGLIAGLGYMIIYSPYIQKLLRKKTKKQEEKETERKLAKAEEDRLKSKE